MKINFTRINFNTITSQSLITRERKNIILKIKFDLSLIKKGLFAKGQNNTFLLRNRIENLKD